MSFPNTKPLLILSFLFLSLMGEASESTISSKTEAVTIYHNGALVSRTAEIDLNTGTHELSFPNISAKSLLNSIKFERGGINILNRSMVKKLTAERKQQLLDERQSLDDQLALLESKYKEVGFIKDVQELERMMGLYTQRILDIKRKHRSVDEQLAKEKELEAFNIENKDAGILQLTISISAPLKGNLEFSYLVGGIGWGPSYDVRVSDVSSANIDLKYSAKVMSQTGEDWNNIRISLSSEFPLSAPKELPNADEPWVVNQPRQKNAMPQGIVQGSAKAYEWQANDDKSRLNTAGIQDLQGVSYEVLRVPAFLEERNLKGRFTLKSNSTVFTYPIMNITLPARFYYYGFPTKDAEAYLVAEIRDWASHGFMDGVANIRYKDVDAGRSKIVFSESTDTLMLAIGQDNSVFLKHEEIADEKYFKEVWASRKSQTTLAYRYIVKNNNAFPITFKLTDQVPVAQQKTDEVTIEKMSGGRHIKETGEVSWTFDLKPGERMEKELIYTVRSENRGSVVLQKARFDNGRQQKYKGVSSPRFF